MSLHLAKGLDLPVSAATDTLAFLGIRGSGKTYGAAVWVEELLQAAVPTVVIDPVGVWWGLRSSADGKAPGLPVTIIGGEHGDVPLESTAGEVIANFVVESGQPCVLDLSSFRKAEQVRFMTAFAERLYNAKAKVRTPLHIVVDEADAYAPQQTRPEGMRLLGAMEDLVRRGRSRGVGLTMITQRAAVLNKNLLTQIDCLVAFRMTSPQDRKAIQEWVSANGTTEQQAELFASLASMPTGDAWFWAPGSLDLFKRVRLRARRTFDSSSTPKAGAKAAAPKRFADVDLEGLKTRIADTIERAAADDPKALRAKVAQLQKELAAAKAVKEPKPPTDLTFIAALARDLADSLDSIVDGGPGKSAMQAPALRGTAKPAKPERPAGITHEAKGSGPVRTTHVAPDGQKIATGERKILTVLAQYPQGRTKVQVALMTEYAHNGGGFNNYLSALRSRGLIDGRGDALTITDAGIAAVGPVEQLPRGDALRERWESKLGKAERAILQSLAGGLVLTKSELAEVAGYEANGGGFNNALSKLRTLELISGRGEMRISEELR